MDTIWSPWRSKYIATFKETPSASDCFLCDAAKDIGNDKEMLVLSRKEHCFVIMNRYPYNNGHLMIAPYSHTGNFEEFTSEMLTELMLTVQEAINILKKTHHPHGFNIGMNIGREAGAGVPDHIHVHVVPRWNGDTNFMPVLSDVKIASDSLENSYDLLLSHFTK